MAKLGRGAKLYVGDGTAPATVFQLVPGLGDVEFDAGSPQFVDTTNHATTQFRTSRTPTHLGEGTFSATLQFDGENAVHTQMLTDMNNLTLKSFRLHDPTSGTPGKRWEFTGYWAGLPNTFPVSGLATAQVSISIEPPVDRVDDV
jgi:hypothetical protein